MLCSSSPLEFQVLLCRSSYPNLPICILCRWNGSKLIRLVFHCYLNHWRHRLEHLHRPINEWINFFYSIFRRWYIRYIIFDPWYKCKNNTEILPLEFVTFHCSSPKFMNIGDSSNEGVLSANAFLAFNSNAAYTTKNLQNCWNWLILLFMIVLVRLCTTFIIRCYVFINILYFLWLFCNYFNVDELRSKNEIE